MTKSVIVLIVIIVVALALYLFVWRPRAQRLRLKIEPVSNKRLDDTPEPTEIIGSVRVKPRQEPRLDHRVEPVITSPDSVPDEAIEPAATAIEPVVETVVETAVAEPIIEELEVEEPAVEVPVKKLEQVDMFPDMEPEPHVPEPLPATIDKVYYLHVMTNHSGFVGSELLRCMLQYGLRFGEMSIFHRHESPSGRGEILFSMAQAVEPGTFDIDEMDRSLIPGVTFFMQLPGHKDLIAYDLMVDTARRLANELGGELLDNASEPVTTEQLDQWRSEIVKYHTL